MRAKLRGLKDTTGQPLFKSDMQSDTRYSLDGLRQMTFPNNGSFDKSKALIILRRLLAAGIFNPAGYYIQAVYRGCCAEHGWLHCLQPDAAGYGSAPCGYAPSMGNPESDQFCKGR